MESEQIDTDEKWFVDGCVEVGAEEEKCVDTKKET